MNFLNFKKLTFYVSILCFNIHFLYGQGQQNNDINWPPAYAPSKSQFYVHNEIEIDAKPETVWQLLIEATKWPLWYKGAQDVSIINSDDNTLKANSIFTWKTMGLKLKSTIKMYEPAKLLAWESEKKSIRGFHVWLIIPTEHGCKVITDESQNGWLTFFEKLFQPKKLYKLHALWLKNLKYRSENLK